MKGTTSRKGRTRTSHTHADSPKRHWLPLKNGTMRPHPHCESCGTVKNISDDRAKRVGYFAHILSEMRHHFAVKGEKPIVDAQARLIIKKLQDRQSFEDAYFMQYSMQRGVFIGTVCDYTNLSINFVEKFVP